MYTSRRSRSGISSLIGAIFFVLVVFLVFTSTVLIFENFTNYATTFKQVNQGDVADKNTVLAVQNLAFGGLSTVSADKIEQGLQAVPNAISRPFLPVQNMNFTNSMNGWTFSRGYELSLHNATVTNYPKNVLPGLDVFTMVITNLDLPVVYPLGTVISSVTLIVNSAWKVPGSAPTYVPQNAPPNWVVSVIGNSITWTANGDVLLACPNGIPTAPTPGPSNNLQFSWSAVAPPVSETYLHDITLTWETFTGPGTCGPAHDHGTATITSNVVPSNQGGVDTEHIASEPLGTIPGGSFGGLDTVSSEIGSESGPDSAYLSFQPTFNGFPITTTTQGGVSVPEQLAAQMNFTTYFTLDSPLALASEPLSGCATIFTGCPDLSFGYSLDHAISGEPPLIFITAFLTYLSPPAAVCPGAPPTPSYKVVLNSTALNLNNNGWLMNDTHFSMTPTEPHPLECSASTMPAGEYELSISVTATMFGATPPSPGYPPSLLMHFDDIGLAFPEAPLTSYCLDTAATGAQPCAPVNFVNPLGAQACPALPQSCGLYATVAPVTASELQSLRFDAHLSITSPGSEVTAYAYLENVQASQIAPIWVELGQVTFTSSADISVSIPASSASSYFDENGGLCSGSSAPGPDPAGSICIRIYAVSATDFVTLSMNNTLTVQTWQQQQSSLLVSNNSTAPLHIVSVYVSGTSGVFDNTSATGPAACPGAGCGTLTRSGGGLWVGGGETTVLQLGLGTTSGLPTSECGLTSVTPNSLKCFSWVSGQTYVVTITTDKGLVVTATFVSP